MKVDNRVKSIAISLVTSMFLVACGGSDSTESLQTDNSLSGSIMKGPINAATIKIKDASGNLVASTISKDGTFAFDTLALDSAYYVVESSGGSYIDEATSVQVDINQNQGLRTLLSKDKLNTILTNSEYIAITPETTIFTELVLESLKTNSLNDSVTQAEALIYSAMIQDSSPMPSLSGDRFLRVGNFTSATPKNESEAFARNRAISFSYMIRDLNLSPEKAFDVIDLLVEDYKDGRADGITLSDAREINVSEEFALSRTKLFQDTTKRLRNGDLSDSEKAQLEAMGFDTEAFNNTANSDDGNLSKATDAYLVSSTLPTLHILPVLSDEDSNSTDTKATYTLTANTNVDVEIQTPEGSWTTPMWRYNNNPLPVVIKTDRGTAMTLNLDNRLDSDSTIHWHGFKIPAIMDGGPDIPVKANSSKTYTFTMDQPAASLWFHPHPDMQTGKQVYMGLAGVYILEDPISKQLEIDNELPSGDKDTILLVQDRRFDGVSTDSRRELLYMDKEMDSDGMLGNTILVNGSVVPKQEVSNTQHRFRLYNVSNARNYDFAMSDGSDFTIVGTDGGLLKNPVVANHIMLGAAQRVEIVVDFAKYSLGDKVMLISKPFNGDMMNMMGTQDMGSNISNTFANGAGINIMRFDITSEEAESITLYTELPTSAGITTRLTEDDANNKGNERAFIMSMDMGSGMNGMGDSGMNGMGDSGMNGMGDSGMNGMGDSGMNGMGDSGMQMSFVINGKAFKADRVDEFLDAGATEIWTIRNMSPMAHPFHAHAIQYQILTRNGVPASGVDLGWKDTFLVQPGETVRIIGNFESAEGDYMYHCHILEHEDAGMMGYFRVGIGGNLDNVAVQTAP